MGKGGGTLGYHYIMTLLWQLGFPIDELVEIVVGDEVAWTGSVTDDTPTRINAPNLFGGQKREGGIQGAFRFLDGADDQVLPGASSSVPISLLGPVPSTVIPDIKALIGQPMGELRRTASILYDGLVCSLSPYPKPWKFRKRRALTGWFGGTVWYPEKAVITLTGDGTYPAGAQGARNTTIKAMNPAHVIYQSLTDPLWGAAQPVASLDENSFIYAANTLCSELFGYCTNWARTEDVDAFIQVVINHIGGALYRDPQTGLWTLRLIRDDYDIADLPVYTFASGILSIEEQDNADLDQGYNQILVTGHDPVNDKDFQVRAQTLAAMQDPDAGIISDARDYKGLPTRALALRVAERDLRPYAAGLKRYKITFDRRAWSVTPAMPIRIQAPEAGLDDVVIRLVDVDYGTPDKPEIVANATEDVFAFSTSAFGTVVAGNPAVTSLVPRPAAATQLLEANYRDLYRLIGATEAQGIADTSGYIGQYARSAQGSAYEFDLASKTSVESDYTVTSNQPFVAQATLAADIGPLDTTITLANNSGIDSDLVGEALHIGGGGLDGEIVRLDAISGDTATIARGCADTVPGWHVAGDAVWPLDDTHGVDQREYAVSEVVDTLVLTRTRSGLLDEGDATLETLTIAGRHALPYPPGNVTIDGDNAYALDDLHTAPVVAWVERNRLTQADQLVAFGDGTVAAEAGATVRIVVFDENNLATPLRTASGLTSSPWTYDGTMQTADGSPVAVWLVIDAERDSLASWQQHWVFVNLVGGYGYAYGMDYGGA